MCRITPPDVRLTKLASRLRVSPKTQAAYTLIDYRGIGLGEASDRHAEWIGAIRTLDWLAPVIPAFLEQTNSEGLQAQVRQLSTEMVISDLAVIESRLIRITSELRRAPRSERADLEQEIALLLSVQSQLEKGIHLTELEISDRKMRILSGFSFLTLKPAVILINTDESAVDQWSSLSELVSKTWPSQRAALVPISAQMEEEANQLEANDRQQFLESYGIGRSATERVSQAVYAATATATAYTWNASQVQAWPVPAGTTAIEFAEMIHSEISKGFISAETLSYNAFMKARTFEEAKRFGAIRREGREYIVKDGDILKILFSR